VRLSRKGRESTTPLFPAIPLTVPVNGSIAPLLAAILCRTILTALTARAPLPHLQSRYTHRSGFAPARSSLSDKAALFPAFSRNQSPGQSRTRSDRIDPDFGVKFFDHQRNAAVKYSRTLTPNFSSQTTLGYIRSTPFSSPAHHTQPAMAFGDGLFQGFNAADGSIFGLNGNVYQLKHDMVYTRGAHSFKWGAELRFNRDSTILETNPNGLTPSRRHRLFARLDSLRQRPA